MVKAFDVHFSLNGGELSPLLWARLDLQKYTTGLARCANFIPLVQGGVTRRPGTRFVHEVKDSTKKVRLVPFVFNRAQSYILECGDAYIRVYMNGGILFDESPFLPLQTEAGENLLTESGEVLFSSLIDPTAAPYEIVSPYLSAEVQELQFAQTADILTIVHPNHPPRTLTRFAHTDWRFAEVQTSNGPFNEENTDENHTLQCSGETGAITLTSSKSLFQAGHVGTLFYLKETNFKDYHVWQVGKNYFTDAQIYWDGNVYAWASNEVGHGRSEAGPNPPLHTEGTRWDGEINGSILWRYLHSGWGIVRITAVASGTSATATVVKRVPRSIVTGATVRWREAAWSEVQGYPRTVTNFEQRQWYASTQTRPQTLWASVAGNFTDFMLGDLADDALQWTINSRRANPIETLSDSGVLNVFAQDREFIATSSANGSAITPDDFFIRPSTSYGSAPVVPETIDNSTLFVDASGFKLIELGYSLQADGYAPTDLTLLAEHITRPGQ